MVAGAGARVTHSTLVPNSELISWPQLPSEARPGIRRDGHLQFEVEMYLQKGCIMVSGVGSSEIVAGSRQL